MWGRKWEQEVKEYSSLCRFVCKWRTPGGLHDNVFSGYFCWTVCI